MKKSEVVYIHLIFWAAIFATKFLTPILTQYLSAEDFGVISYYVHLLSPIFFYAGYVGIMRIKSKRNFLLFSFIGIVSICLILFGISKTAFAYGVAPIPSIFLWTTIGGLFRFFIDWFEKRNDVVVLERENVTSNLALLKNQLNPHFLFNTLHNIDTLIYDNQEKASESLIKLSNIMRYMLKEAKFDFVDVYKEIEHLEDYLSLEKLRLKNEKFLDFNISGNWNDIKIAPMILIPFVENAFKHSVDSSIENGIRINISIQNQVLLFVCENQHDPFETEKDEVHGIGLETVKKRLNLIYPHTHELTIDSDDQLFIVNLELELNEN